MREQYFEIAQLLREAQDQRASHDQTAALKTFASAVNELRAMPPERLRDALLAHAFLGRYRCLASGHEAGVQKVALESLHLGVSYARTSKDPTVRALAEECLLELERVEKRAQGPQG